MTFLTRRVLAIVFLGIITISCARPAVAGPWIPPAEHGLVDITYSTYEAKNLFNQSGDVIPLGATFRDNYINVYGEHGISPKTAFIWNINFLSLTRSGTAFTPGLSNSGPGDWMVGVRQSLGTKGNYSHALELDVGTPMFYNASAPLPLGLSSLDLTLTYQGGMLWGNGPNRPSAYFNYWAGYRARLGPAGDQVVYGLGGGLPVVGRLTLYSQLSGIWGLGSKATPINASLLSRNYDIGDLSVGAAYDFTPDFNVHLSHMWDLYGANAGKGGAWQLGVTAKY